MAPTVPAKFAVELTLRFVVPLPVSVPPRKLNVPPLLILMVLLLMNVPPFSVMAPELPALITPPFSVNVPPAFAPRVPPEVIEADARGSVPPVLALICGVPPVTLRMTAFGITVVTVTVGLLRNDAVSPGFAPGYVVGLQGAPQLVGTAQSPEPPLQVHVAASARGAPKKKIAATIPATTMNVHAREILRIDRVGLADWVIAGITAPFLGPADRPHMRLSRTGGQTAVIWTGADCSKPSVVHFLKYRRCGEEVGRTG